jgi:hypothetical protein
MPSKFYFAWVDDTDTVFGPEHYVEDEAIFSMELTHNEGDFPTVVLEILNPKVGLLSSSRKQWAWVSCITDSGEVKPICFGRIVGVPSDIVENICSITLVCRPKDFITQKEELAASMKVLPYYDRAFIAYEKHHVADNVLEAYSSLWHCDRFSSTLTASDIISGEDGTVTLDRGKVFYDSLGIARQAAPISAVTVRARAEWAQAGEGTIDITKNILDAFAIAQTDWPAVNISGDNPYGEYKIPLLMGASGMVSAWPKTGSSMGGGWQVATSSLQYIGKKPNGDVLVGPAGVMELPEEDASAIFTGRGIVVSITGGEITHTWDTEGNGDYKVADTTYTWIPITPVAPHMEIFYEASRSRSETLEFTLVSDIQPVLYEFSMSDTDDVATTTIDVGSAKVDDARDPPEGSDTETTDYNTMPIVDARRASYFQTDRGMQSIRYLMLRARASILASARAVEVSVEQDFDEGLELSLRKNASLTDPRIPGNTAIGKITKYTLSYDGSSGSGVCGLTFACTVGEGSALGSINEGTDTYVEDDYVSEDFAVKLWKDDVVATEDIKWDSSLVTGKVIDDDGLNLMTLDAISAVASCTVTGGLDKQAEQVHAVTGYKTSYLYGVTPRTYAEYSDTEELASNLGIKTSVAISLRNVTEKTFSTEYRLGSFSIIVPKGIDLG